MVTKVCFVTPADCTTDSVTLFQTELKRLFSKGPKNLQFKCYSAVGRDLPTAAGLAVAATPNVIVAGGRAAAAAVVTALGGGADPDRYGGRRVPSPTAQPDGLPS